MKYKLRDLITFVNVINLKSFSKTAKVLNISKSNVTKRINDLEKNIGINLIARTTREVNLTPDGKKFLEHCNKILKASQNLDGFIDSYKGVYGTLRIVLPPYYSRYHVVPYMNDFLKKYPDLTLDIVLDEDPVNIIEEGFDLQVRIQIPQDENLQVAKLSTNSKVLCASPKYLKKYSIPKKPEDLRNHNCIIFGENQLWKFRKTGQITTMKDLKGNVRCNNGEIIKELVLSGSGITVKSDCDIQNEIKSGKIVTLLNDYEIINETEFYAVYPDAINESPKIKAFVDFFKLG